MKKTHNDAFQRMNYLIQAAHRAMEIEAYGLARFYAYTMLQIAKRNVLKLDMSIKRSLCKRCFILWLTGVTVKVRIRATRQTHEVWQCMHCSYVKRYLCRRT